MRELIFSAVDRDPAHLSQQRRDPGRLRATLRMNESLLSGNRKTVILLDDLLTTGCGFAVCKGMLMEKLPDVNVVGIFVARRVFPSAAEAFKDAL